MCYQAESIVPLWTTQPWFTRLLGLLIDSSFQERVVPPSPWQRPSVEPSTSVIGMQNIRENLVNSRGGSRDFERGMHHRKAPSARGYGGMPPQKSLKSRSSKMQFPCILGIKWWGNGGKYVSGPTRKDQPLWIRPCVLMVTEGVVSS